eukprot:15479767-Alexandrium_andersonii.AAC.1
MALQWNSKQGGPGAGTASRNLGSKGGRPSALFLLNCWLEAAQAVNLEHGEGGRAIEVLASQA